MSREVSRRVGATAALLAAIVAASPASAGPPLRRDLASYIVFGLRNVGLKNFRVQGACNTGVNCAQPSPNSSCGVVSHENAQYGEGSQIAGDRARFNRPGATVWQVFSNDVSTLANVTLGLPPVEPLTPLPILDDEDGDGTPSCSNTGGQCAVDTGDLAAACGFPDPFPACAPGSQVVVVPGGDCSGGADAAPGNGRCDLPAGTYGALQVQSRAKLTLVGGVYALCAFTVGQTAEVIADGPAILNVTGDVSISNDSSFGPAPGQDCGKITVNANGPGSVTFGRQVKVNGYFCGPERLIRLGHDNDLTGRFFGDTVDSDDNNRAFCCQDACPVGEPVAQLRRDLPSYFVLGQRKVSLKDLQLDSPCNVGVNCGPAGGSGSCGVLAMSDVTLAIGSQAVGDQVFTRRPGARLWQLFRNGGGPVDDIELLAPPEMPFTAPVIPGTCTGCESDVAALEAACGFPVPFPACDSGRPVRATRDADCDHDTTPGNQQCDLAPGVYGGLSVLNDSRLSLAPGTYVFCRVKVGKQATVDTTAATVLVPNRGSVKIGNGSEVGEDCGDLTLLAQGRSIVGFGRSAFVAARVCAPESLIKLGHANTLIGQFVGDQITSDSNNQGRCCCPTP